MNGIQTTERKTVAPETRTRRDVAFLGVDSEEYCHVLLRDQRRVVRLDETGIERTIDLGGKTDVRYRAWVENQIGWETRETLIPVEMHRALGGA